MEVKLGGGGGQRCPAPNSAARGTQSDVPGTASHLSCHPHTVQGDSEFSLGQ